MELKLSETQSNFLSRYYSNLGSIKDALDDLGLDYLHFRNWLNDNYFKAKFEEMKIEVGIFLRHDNDGLAERQLNHILHNGIQEIEIIEYEEVDHTGEIVRTSKATKTKSKVSLEAIKQQLGEKTTEYCIKVLAERGILDKTIARRLLSTANEYQLKLQSSFGNNENSDRLTDEKSIAIVKTALLGSGNSIE
ncbi:MAG: hypothetical protein HC907_17805 [Richelia sp. SM1_7_0]|nr:hypothetical protein [Richelia sp. SM1_7_0]